MTPRIKHPDPETTLPERRYGFTLRPEDARWLDRVIAGARLEGVAGIGVSAVVRLALSRLEAAPVDQVVGELIRLREGNSDQ